MLVGRVVDPGAPLWTQSDTDLAIALTELEDDRHECGHPRSESMDPANEFAYTAEPVRCHACAAADRASRNRPESLDDAGIRWITLRRDRG